jgi:hypothetical protein
VKRLVNQPQNRRGVAHFRKSSSIDERHSRGSGTAKVTLNPVRGLPTTISDAGSIRQKFNRVENLDLGEKMMNIFRRKERPQDTRQTPTLTPQIMLDLVREQVLSLESRMNNDSIRFSQLETSSPSGATEPTVSHVDVAAQLPRQPSPVRETSAPPKNPTEVESECIRRRSSHTHKFKSVRQELFDLFLMLRGYQYNRRSDDVTKKPDKSKTWSLNIPKMLSQGSPRPNPNTPTEEATLDDVVEEIKKLTNYLEERDARLDAQERELEAMRLEMTRMPESAASRPREPTSNESNVEPPPH